MQDSSVNSFGSWNCCMMKPAALWSWDPTEADEHLHDKWLQEFCTQVADQEMRKQLEQIIKQQYQEKGW